MRHVLSASMLAVGLAAFALPASSLAQPVPDYRGPPPMDRHPPPPPPHHDDAYYRHHHHHHRPPPPPPPRDYERHP